MKPDYLVHCPRCNGYVGIDSPSHRFAYCYLCETSFTHEGCKKIEMTNEEQGPIRVTDEFGNHHYGKTVADALVNPPAEVESVDHPQHYGGADNPYEAIKVIEAWELGFALGNTIKYISRAGKKCASKEVEDLNKAKWYLERHIENLSKDLT